MCDNQIFICIVENVDNGYQYCSYDTSLKQALKGSENELYKCPDTYYTYMSVPTYKYEQVINV